MRRATTHILGWPSSREALTANVGQPLPHQIELLAESDHLFEDPDPAVEFLLGAVDWLTQQSLEIAGVVLPGAEGFVAE